MDDLFQALLISVGPFLALLIIGFVSGTLAQIQHLRRLEAREAEIKDFLLTTVSFNDDGHAELVSGSTVVAYDFFRRVAVILRKLIGGRFRMHEAMMMRARREAVLRMAETAQQRGATAIYNIRLVSSNLGANGSSMGGCEVLAYGTAIWDT